MLTDIKGGPIGPPVAGSQVDKARNFFAGMPNLEALSPDQAAGLTEEEIIRENQEIWTHLLEIYKLSDITGLGFLVEALWDKINLFFLPMWDGLANSFAVYSQLAVIRAIRIGKNFLDEENVVATLMDSIDRLKNARDVGEVYAALDNFSRAHPVLSFFPLAAVAVGNFTGFLTTALEAKREKFAQAAREAERPALPGLGDALELRWKSGMPDAEIVEVFEKIGFPAKYHAPFIKASEFTPTNEEIGVLLNRGDISEEKATELMRANRVSTEGALLHKKLFKPIPPVQDLVRFAVREVFSPDIVREFGLDAEFPEEFAVAAAKVGLTRDWAIAYWRAHWELPSLGMGYDMFHRGIIDERQLGILMKTMDVMPYWRQKLMDLSHNPFTRVDIRRMHKAGVLTEAQVFRSYKDLGYNDEKAQALTRFTLKINAEEVKEAAKGDILGAFKRGVVTESEAKAMLKDIGYGVELAEFLLLKEVFDKEKKARDAVIRFVGRNYVQGRITQAQALVKLAEADVVGTQAQDLLDDWEIEKKDLHVEVSVGQLSEMYAFKVIDRLTLLRELTDKGYDAIDVDRLALLIEKKAKAGG